MLISVFLLALKPVQAESEATYYRLQGAKSSDENDLKITSIGMIGFNRTIMGHMDISYLQSDLNGDGFTLDFGFGRVYNWHADFYIGIGASIGFNQDNDKEITSYFPQAGIVVNITESIGLTISQKRYYDLYNRDEDVTMLGFVFR